MIQANQIIDSRSFKTLAHIKNRDMSRFFMSCSKRLELLSAPLQTSPSHPYHRPHTW
jgi:hypothetical protein